ncbi:Cytosol non-specific dipeptidase [Phycisphaerae bacterium RAS1]|nr:Cytosol non-specific dipeptidase [Phycisphaerae bacterium RAS1]
MAINIESLEPRGVWGFFAGMTAVPRPSKHEERIRAHVRQVAEKLGFKSREDVVGNIVIDVSASPGCEKAAVTVLQGHLDMVCEKNSDTAFDFDRDPIRTVIDKDARSGEPIVRADGTTLGADNGIGVSLALAAATDPNVRHGPLEILCTIDEEAGMTGAKALQPGFLKGRRLINLDSEEDDAIYIGCAGGIDASVIFDLKTGAAPAGGELLRVSVGGLRGGHSGCDIHLNRGNAIKLLAQTLTTAGVEKLQLAKITGGSKRNAIPREASALLAAPAGSTAALKKAAEAAQKEIIAVFGEEGGRVTVEPASAADAAGALSIDDTRRVLTALAALPSGVLAVVPEIPGLIQTSTAVTVVEWSGSAGGMRIVIGCLSRGSHVAQLQGVVRQIEAVARLAGAQAETGNSYPGWQPNVNSPTLAVCRRVYERLFNEKPRVTAIHAGLECGIIDEQIRGMDMVSFGPHIEGPHSPDERVYINSVAKTYRMLSSVLDELSRA